jgi:methylamine dehydrogenase accessory protein MauD
MSTLFLISYITLWVLVLALVLVSILILRQIGMVYLKTAGGVSRGGLSIGTRLPDLQLPLLGGGRVILSENRHSRTLIVFTSPKCAPCQMLLPHLANFVSKATSTRVVLVVQDATNEEVAEFTKNLPAEIEVVPTRDRSLFEEVFKGEVTPFAFCIDQNLRVVHKGLANDLQDLLHMTDDAKEESVA